MWYAFCVIYHPDDFIRLTETVEQQGGARLEEACVPSMFKLKVPDHSGDMRWKRFHTSGCRNHSRFVVQYDPGEEVSETHPSGGLMTACAVDDDMGKWPRFAHAMQEDSF